MTRCTVCGFDNPPGMRFCGNCGARLVDFVAPVEEGSSSTSLPTEGLGVLMGADLVERLRQAGLEAGGQRRNVTVLFADLSGYTALSGRLDEEDLYEIVQQFIRLMSSNIYKYEGIVDKFTGDGLMALFGAPIAHENNAERAVRAAIDMQSDLDALNQTLHEEIGVELQMRVGLHSGSVIVGGIGSNMLMDYTAIGDTVNLAHRIEEAAPAGTILITEAVNRQVRALFDCQQVTVLNPKGFAHPVIAYRVLGARAKPESVRGIEGLYAPMIGRDKELIQLQQASEAHMQDSWGQFALITGEAGIGKSRLTTEFKDSLDLRTVRILEGQSLVYRRSIPYWIFRDVILSILELPAGVAPERLQMRLAQQVYLALGDQADDTIPFLEHMMALPYSDSKAAERLRYLDSEQLRQQIFLAVRDLLLAESNNRPLLLILDDLHWADDASMELLRFLVEALRQAPIFILAIARTVLPGVMEKTVEWSHNNLEDQFLTIQLQHLSLDQSDQLLHHLLSTAELPDRLREHILQRAAGIPFYLEEILRMMIDEGSIVNEYGRWRVEPGVDPGSLGVPDTLQGLIMARFDRLGSLPKRILQVASVIGKNFSLPVLSAVMPGGSVKDLQNNIDILIEREFIISRASKPTMEYTFRHILMSDAIYSTMLRKERSKLHGQVGEVVELLYAGRLEDQVELLANHYRWSPKLDRALHYLILAGQKAARNNANTQAYKHYNDALELFTKIEHQPHQDLQVHMGLGDTLVFNGEYPEARIQFQSALQAIAAQDSELYAEECSSLYRRLARTYERQGDHEQALSYLGQAQNALDYTTTLYPVERAQVWHDIAWIYFRQGNFLEAQQRLQDALNLVESSEAYDVIASIYNRLAGVAYNQGEWDEAARFLRQSITIRESIQDVVGLAASLNNLGYLEIEMGEYDNALETLSRSYELKKRLGHTDGIAVTLNNLGWLRTVRGDVDEAERALQGALDLANQIGYSSLIRQTRKNVGELYLAMQEWERAQQILCEVVPAWRELGANDQLLDTYRLLGEAALGGNDIVAAQSWETKINQLVETMNDVTEELSAVQQGELYRFRGMLATYLDDWAMAQEYLDESEQIFGKLHSRLYQGRVAYQVGVLAEKQGQVHAAYERFDQAALLFQAVGAKLEECRAYEARDHQGV